MIIEIKKGEIKVEKLNAVLLIIGTIGVIVSVVYMALSTGVEIYTISLTLSVILMIFAGINLK